MRHFLALGRQRPSFVVLATGALVLALYGGAVGSVLVTGRGDPVSLAWLSTAFPGQRFWTPSTPLLRSSVGYDGQFYYYLARDPLLLGGPPTYLDSPSYRYQRILLPALAYVIGLGQPGAIGWTLPLVNLLAFAAGCWAALQLIEQLGANRWWLLAYALNPGYLIGLPFDLGEPLALGLVTLATLAYSRERHGVAVVLLAAAGLAREVALLVSLAFGAYAILRLRSRRPTALYALPWLIVLAWDLVVLARLGSFPLSQSAEHFELPLSGPFVAILRLAGLAPDSPIPPFEGAALGAVVLLVAAVFGMGLAAVLAFRFATPFHWQLGVQGLFVLTWDVRVWQDPVLSLLRNACFLAFFWVLVLGTSPSVLRETPRKG